MIVEEATLLAGDEFHFADCCIILHGTAPRGMVKALQAYEYRASATFHRGGSIHVIEFPSWFTHKTADEFDAFREFGKALAKYLHEAFPSLDIEARLGTGLSMGYQREVKK